MLLPPKPVRALALRNRTIFLSASAIAATCGFGLGLGLRGTPPAAAGPAPAPPAPASLIGAPFAQFTSERNYLSGRAPPAPPRPAAPWSVMAVPAPIAQLCAVAPARAVNGDEGAAVALAADGQPYLVWQGGSAAPLTGVPPLPTTGGARVGTFELPPAAAAAAAAAAATGTGSGGAFGVATCDTSGCAWYSCATTSGSTAACAPAAGFAPLTTALGSPVRHLVMHPRGVGELFVSLEAAAGADKSLLRRVTPGAAAPTVTPLGADVHGSTVTALALDTTAAADAADANANALVDLAVATDLAVFRGFNGSHFARHELVGGLIDAPPTALAFVAGDDAQEADLWVGHEFCLNVVRGGGGSGGGSGGGGGSSGGSGDVERRRVDRVSGPQGLPLGNITALVAGAEPGTLWVGGRTGLALLRSRPAAGEDRWRFFGGDRWLAGDDAVGALAAANTAGPPKLSTPAAWAATQGGLALLRSRSVLLSDAAAAYTDRATTALSRHGWIAAGRLARYGDTDNRTPLPGGGGGSLALHDGDNDGLWTAMFVAAQIFRLGATGAIEARALAWKHLGAVEFLHNVTGTAGFIARTAVRCGEPHQGGDGGICPGGAPNTCGWVNSSACFAGVDLSAAAAAAAADADADADAGGGECCWTWKRDTSSDEVTAHFFVLALAHERLARTDAERARVARLVCSTAGYIVDGGYVFVDPVSGKGTSWAYWDPAQLNGVPGKPNERGQNSLELLGILAVAAKVCDGGGSGGGGRFGAAFATMVREHGYDRNAVDALLTSPQGLAFFDFRLAFMAFYNLATAAPQLLVEHPQQQQQQQPSREGKTEGGGAAAAAAAVIPLTVAEAAACRARLQASLRRYWDEPGASVTARNNRLLVYSVLGRIVFGSGGGGGGGGGDTEQGAQLSDETWQLRRYPAGPLVDWPAANSRRLDVRLQRDWATCPAGQCASNVVVEAVLPADEALTMGSSDFVTEAAMNSVDGGGGFTENAPNAWLLGYWMARFHDGTE